jgi:hypothetical protein
MIELRDNLRVVANASTVPVLWMKTSKQMKMKWNESIRLNERLYRIWFVKNVLSISSSRNQTSTTLKIWSMTVMTSKYQKLEK